MKRILVKVPRPCDCEAWPFCKHEPDFTKGEWFVSHEDPHKVVSDNYGVVAWTPNDYEHAEHLRWSKASARLISAAPRLLYACMAMLKDNHELGELSRPVANQARAAIHKAGVNYHR